MNKKQNNNFSLASIMGVSNIWSNLKKLQKKSWTCFPSHGFLVKKKKRKKKQCLTFQKMHQRFTCESFQKEATLSKPSREKLNFVLFNLLLFDRFMLGPEQFPSRNRLVTN